MKNFFNVSVGRSSIMVAIGLILMLSGVAYGLISLSHKMPVLIKPITGSGPDMGLEMPLFLILGIIVLLIGFSPPRNGE